MFVDVHRFSLNILDLSKEFEMKKVLRRYDELLTEHSITNKLDSNSKFYNTYVFSVQNQYILFTSKLINCIHFKKRERERSTEN
jgi:hypothetical protein